MPHPATLVDRYRLEEQLGEGGMGTVYRAVQIALDRPVALKVIGADLVSSAEFRERFRQEGRLAARLVHPHVVRLLDFDENDEGAYIAYELVEALSLESALERGGLDAPARRRAALHIALGLAAVHDAGILHRDLKPSNVLVTPDGSCKITDLGIAYDVASQVRRTRTGVILGTLEYISPEQITGAPLSTATDVYQLGCVLYALLAGRAPFAGGSSLEILTAHVHKEPARPPLTDPLDEPLWEIAQRALAKDPAARPTLSEVVDGLARDLPASVSPSGGFPVERAKDRGHRRAGAVSDSRPDARDVREHPEGGSSARPPAAPSSRTPAPGAGRGVGQVTLLVLVGLACGMGLAVGVAPWKSAGGPAGGTGSPSATAGATPTPSSDRGAPADASPAPDALSAEERIPSMLLPGEKPPRIWDTWHMLEPLVMAPKPDVKRLRERLRAELSADMGPALEAYVHWVKLGRWLEKPVGDPPRSSISEPGLPDPLEDYFGGRAIEESGHNTPQKVFGALRVMAIFPDDARGWLGIGFLLDLEGKIAEARRTYMQALRRVQALGVGRCTPGTWAGLVRALRHFHPRQLEAKFVTALATHEQDIAPWQGVQIAYSNDPRGLRAQLERFWARPHRQPFAAILIGEEDLAQGRPWDEVRTSFLVALAEFPEFEPLRSHVIGAALGRGRLEEAQALIARAPERESWIATIAALSGPQAGRPAPDPEQLDPAGLVRELCRRLEARELAGAEALRTAAAAGEPHPIPESCLRDLDLRALGSALPVVAERCRLLLFGELERAGWIAAAGAFTTPAAQPMFTAYLAEARARGVTSPTVAVAEALWHSRCGRLAQSLALAERLPPDVWTAAPHAISELLIRPLAGPAAEAEVAVARRILLPATGWPAQAVQAFRAGRWAEVSRLAGLIRDSAPGSPLPTLLAVWAARAAKDPAALRTALDRGRLLTRFNAADLFTLRALDQLASP